MKFKSRQEIFDLAYLGLKSQEWQKSKADWGSCAYRGMGGLKCAIGHCMPDSEYTGDLEGLGGGDSDVLDVIKFDHMDATFVTILQFAHDSASSPTDMEDTFGRIADMYGLSIPKEDNTPCK